MLDAPRVLLVDDTPANLVALAAVLRPVGAELLQASSGQAAIELVKDNWFAVILLDVQMPTMDGFETAARIRRTERGREVPIIFVTAICRDDVYVVRGYEAGAADYITKPYDANVVRARVKAFVDLFRQRERQKHERLQAAVDSAPAVVTILRLPDYACEYANQEYRRLFGESGGPAGGFARSARFVTSLERVAATGEVERLPEYVLDGDGSDRNAPYRVFDIVLQPLRDAQGRVDAVICFAVETTEHVRARRDLEHARVHAEQANRAKDVVLATVSHELRNPLSSILGWTLNAKRHAATPELERALAVIERSARAQVRLIDDILDQARSLGHPLRLEVAPVDLGATVEGAVEALRPVADAKGITLDVVIDEVVPIDADAARLEQAVANVVSNALKFTDAKGKVNVLVSRIDTGVVIGVTDTGDGIEPSFLPHLFEPFRQGDVVTGRRNDGLGLGLAIVDQIVRGHGGSVRASSRGKGFGTTIEIELPCGERPPESTRAPLSRPGR